MCHTFNINVLKKYLLLIIKMFFHRCEINSTWDRKKNNVYFYTLITEIVITYKLIHILNTYLEH